MDELLRAGPVLCSLLGPEAPQNRALRGILATLAEHSITIRHRQHILVSSLGSCDRVFVT